MRALKPDEGMARLSGRIYHRAQHVPLSFKQALWRLIISCPINIGDRLCTAHRGKHRAITNPLASRRIKIPFFEAVWASTQICSHQ